MFVDKLNRKIEVGDIVARSSPYGSDLYIAKVYRITERAVSMRFYGKKIEYSMGNYYYEPYSILSLSQLLLEEPQSWTSWTNIPEKKLLILKKNKK